MGFPVAAAPQAATPEPVCKPSLLPLVVLLTGRYPGEWSEAVDRGSPAVGHLADELRRFARGR